MNKILSRGLMAALFVTPLTQVAAQEVDEIVVSATGIPTPAHEVGASVDVITAADLEARQITYLQDALKLKGINVPQSGGPGTLSNVFLRGLPGKYTDLVVDGISMFDTGSNQVMWNDVITDGVGHVEILRGSQGVLYGSNTIAGVISQFTAIGGEHENDVRLETGEMASHKVTLTGKGTANRIEYGYGLSQFSSDSISASSTPASGSSVLDDDSYENMTLNTKLRAHLGEAVSIDLVMRQSSGSLDKDGFSSDQSGVSEDFDRATLRVSLDAETEGWQHRIGLTHYDATIEDFSNNAKTGERLSARQTLDYRGIYDARDGVKIIIGADQENAEFENTDTGFSAFSKADIEVTGLYGLTQVEIGERTNVTLALRQDDHELFGTHMTYRSTLAYQAGKDTVLRVAHGTGFRAPSLSELYLAFYGNADLQPETSTSTEVGFDVTASQGIDLSATAFISEIEDIIGFDPVTYVNRQVAGTSEISGFEVTASFAPTPKFSLSFDATYTDSKKPDASGSGMMQREVRVPRMQMGLVAEYAMSGRVNLGGSLRVVQDTLDVGSVDLDDYTLLDLRAKYLVTETMSAYVRLENASDEDYEVINGFSTPGRAAYVGVTTSF